MRVNRRTLAASSAALVLTAASAAAEPDSHAKTILQCNQELKTSQAALEAAGESASKFIHDCWWHTKAGQRTPIAGSSPPVPKPDETAAKLRKAEAAAAKAQAETAVAKEEAARARQETARAKQDAAEARKTVAAQAVRTPADAAASPRVETPAPKAVAVPQPDDEPTRARHARTAMPDEHSRHVAARSSPHWTYVRPRFARAEPASAPRRWRVARRVAGDDVPVAQPTGMPEGVRRTKAPVDLVPLHIVGVPAPVWWPVYSKDVPAFRHAINHPIVPGIMWTP